jgi:hypothetical protein
MRYIQNIVLLLACLGSLLLASHADVYQNISRKYKIPPYVLKGILKVEGVGLDTKWNKDYPSHHAYGPTQMTCIAVKELGYIKTCNRNNSYRVKDYKYAEHLLTGVKGVEMGAKYLNHIKKQYHLPTWGSVVRTYNQGYGGRNNRNAYAYQKKTGVK